jgi:hypothetical protein
MRPLAMFIWVVLFGTALCRAEVREVPLSFYAESVSLHADGGATVTVRCTAQGLSSGDTIAVPYAYAAWPDSVRCGEKVGSVFSRMLYGRRQAFLTTAGEISENDTLEFLFHLDSVSSLGKESSEDFGNRSIAYKLVQSSAAPIAVMSARIVLPPDMVVSSIVSSTPPRKANAPSSPYMLGMLEGRHFVAVTDSTAHQGDVLAITFQAKPAGKSPFFAIGLALCAVVYLVAFRELLKS